MKKCEEDVPRVLVVVVVGCLVTKENEIEDNINTAPQVRDMP